MGKLLSILSLFIFSLGSCRQSNKESDKQYYFQDIGLQITIPKGYQADDTFIQESFTSEDGEPITDSAKIKELKTDSMKGLLSVSTSDLSTNGMYLNNTAVFNIALRSTKTGNFEQYYDFHREMQYTISKGQMGNIDTLSSTLKVGNITFRKFLTFSTTTTLIQYSGIYVAPVKNYFLVVRTNYTDKKFGEDIENAILTSKFD
jgi:hypothetical protein